MRVALGSEDRMEDWLGVCPVAGGFVLTFLHGGDYALSGVTESHRASTWECGPAVTVLAGGAEELGLCLAVRSRCACCSCPASLTLSLYCVGLMPWDSMLR